jgi:formylglycine-generating enzyme required for sulfatase activity
MFDYVTHAIVRILDAGQRPVGAGCLVRDRLIVTCAHVVAEALGLPRGAAEAPAAPVTLDFPYVPATAATARVVLWWPYRQAVAGDRRHDLALLELEHPPGTVEPASLLRTGHERPGPIFVYGFPEGAGLGDVGDWIEGRVAPPLPNGWLKLIQRDQAAAFIEPGCSGGPVVVEEAGRVVGIVSLRRSGSGPTEAYGISAALIREALGERSAAAGSADEDALGEGFVGETQPEPRERAEAPPVTAAVPASAETEATSKEPPQPRIFLAHAKEDKPQVRALYQALNDCGFAPWFDEVDLVPGQVWPVEIPKAIRAAGVFLACLSSRSVGKQGYVQSEFRTALTTFGERPPGSIWLIPVKLDDCEIPDLQIPDRGISLRDIHWLDLGQDKGFERLVRAIEVALPRTVSASLASDQATLRGTVTTRHPPFDAGGAGRPTGVIDVGSLPDATAHDDRELRPADIERTPATDRGDEQAADGADTGSNALTPLVMWFQRLISPFPVEPSRRAASVVLVAIVAMGAGVALVASGVLGPRGGTVTEILPRDCVECPEMVVVPAGSFMRGSPEDEEGRWHAEGPQREVTIAEPFAIGEYEVTFNEWDACVKAGGCNGYDPSSPWGRGQRPVINVSWNDAQAYVSWLKEKTGEGYRLPSEAEWEHAARADTTTRYSWGNDIRPENANYGSSVGGTTAVGSYPDNPWGLSDMHGNVWEWVEDCWNETYRGAPEDGSAWTAGNCSHRVVRGGSWNDGARYLRSAYRIRYEPDIRSSTLGFRVARTLTP